MKLFIIILLMISVSGCATTTQTKPVGPLPKERKDGLYHKIEKGQTLWRISRLYDVSVDTLVQANSIDDMTNISTGRLIFIPSTETIILSGATVKSANDSFVWPVRGEVVSSFNSKTDSVRNKGIDIRTAYGNNIKASRTGRIVFCDDRFKGFGKTIIIDHGDGYQTIYAYNSQILVKVGETVSQNDVIARAGKTGRASIPSLHFEIRKDGRAQNPYYFLPQ